jgi:hypothetical protein
MRGRLGGGRDEQEGRGGKGNGGNDLSAQRHFLVPCFCGARIRPSGRSPPRDQSILLRDISALPWMSLSCDMTDCREFDLEKCRCQFVKSQAQRRETPTWASKTPRSVPPEVPDGGAGDLRGGGPHRLPPGGLVAEHEAVSSAAGFSAAAMAGAMPGYRVPNGAVISSAHSLSSPVCHGSGRLSIQRCLSMAAASVRSRVATPAGRQPYRAELQFALVRDRGASCHRGPAFPSRCQDPCVPCGDHDGCWYRQNADRGG